MILFDNLYFITYTYFKRTNFGKWGPKSTAIILTSYYLFFSIVIFFTTVKVGNYYINTINELSISILSKKYFWWENETILVFTSILSYILLSIRYCYFMKYDQIHEIKNNMRFRKRRVIDDLTILYLIIAPFLMYFLVDFANELYK
jgi:hypothetical protein